PRRQWPKQVSQPRVTCPSSLRAAMLRSRCAYRSAELRWSPQVGPRQTITLSFTYAALLPSRFVVAELDLAAVVRALAQQPEAGGGQHAAARLDVHHVVLAHVERGLLENDAGAEDARAALARVLWIAGHEALLARGDVVELDLDLVVVEGLGEEG